MEIILSKQCEALTGSLGEGFGYYIRRAPHKDGSVRFFSQRSKHSPVPVDGHLRFIFACAELAQNKLHITDIRVSAKEFQSALNEAGLFSSAAHDVRHELSATDIINYRRVHLPDMV